LKSGQGFRYISLDKFSLVINESHAVLLSGFGNTKTSMSDTRKV